MDAQTEGISNYQILLAPVMKKLAPFANTAMSPEVTASTVGPVEQDSSVLTPASIRHGDRYALIQHVVNALDRGIVLTEPLMQTLVGRVFADNLDEKENPDTAISWLPETESASANQQVNRMQVYEKGNEKIGEWDLYGIVKPAVLKGTSKTFPDGLIDGGDERDRDALGEVVFTMFKKLSLDQKKQLTKYIAYCLATTRLQTDRAEEMREALFGDTSKLGALEEDKSNELYNVFLQSFFSRSPAYLYGESVGSPLNDLLDYAAERKPKFVLDAVRSIATFAEADQKKAISILVDRFGYARILNTIRKQVDEAKTDIDRADSERLGKMLLGYSVDDPRNFYTQLSQVYAAWNFNDFEANRNAQNYDEKLIEDAVYAATDEPLVVDLGSGTGRLANITAANTDAHVVGIELSEDNLRIAKKAAVDAQLGDQVEYILGDWNTEGILGKRKADLVYCLGRSLAHAETSDDLEKALANVVDVVKKGGQFIFDFPDPNRGVILRRRRELADHLRKLGIPIAEIPIPGHPGETMPDSDIIVDSPNGIDFYNRRIPQLDKLARMLDYHGLKFEIIDEQPIIGGGYSPDDRNIYIRAIKVARGHLESVRDSRAMLEKILNQTRSPSKQAPKGISLSGLQQDDE